MSNQTDCTWQTPYTETIAAQFRNIIYHYLTIPYIIIGCAGNLILLAAFYRQSKTEKAYGYQVIFTVSKILEIFTFGTFLITVTWLGAGADKQPWFTRTYFLMIIFCYLFFVLHLAMIACSLWLAVAMAADRVFAVFKPMRYQKVNHKMHQIVSTSICFLIGLCGSGVYFSAIKITQDDFYGYSIDKDMSVENGLAGVISAQFRIVSRLGGVCLLIVLNVAMVLIFKRQKRKIAVSSNQSQERERLRKSKERTLLWINIYQACMMLANQMPHVVWNNIVPQSITDCYGTFVGPACDLVIMLTDALDFFIVIAINRRMRKLVFDTLPNSIVSSTTSG